MNNLIYPVPTWSFEKQEVVDGTLLPSPAICSRARKRFCRKHYENISTRKGFHTCHMGLSSYSSGDEKRPVLTAIRVADFYDSKKLKQVDDFLPTLPRSLILNCFNKLPASTAIDSVSNENVIAPAEEKDLIDFSLHEIRKINTQIKRHAEELMYGSVSSDDRSYVSFVEWKSKIIFAASSMLSTRLGIYDFEKNPAIITANLARASLYKKFDKARIVLDAYAKDKKVAITQFSGSSFYEIEAYSVLDFLPFVILENAIKYSPSHQDISVSFEDTTAQLKVVVSSMGPKNSEDDLKMIFLKRARGKIAKDLDSAGGGYGLYFGKLICDLHNIEISATSENIARITLNGHDYSQFTVTLKLNK